MMATGVALVDRSGRSNYRIARTDASCSTKAAKAAILDVKKERVILGFTTIFFFLDANWTTAKK